MTTLSTPEEAKLHAAAALGGHGVDGLSYGGLITNHLAILTSPVPLSGHGANYLSNDGLVLGHVTLCPWSATVESILVVATLIQALLP